MIAIWTLYDHPRDYPKHFVVREWRNLQAASETHLFETLEGARTFCRKKGLMQLARSPNDDPVIVETWL